MKLRETLAMISLTGCISQPLVRLPDSIDDDESYAYRDCSNTKPGEFNFNCGDRQICVLGIDEVTNRTRRACMKAALESRENFEKACHSRGQRVTTREQGWSGSRLFADEWICL